MERGITQGCCFSPLAFILALELLAIKNRNNGALKGLKLKGGMNRTIVLKILLYADDITLFMQDKKISNSFGYCCAFLSYLRLGS